MIAQHSELVLAYRALAPHYEAFAGDYRHDEWLRALEVLARRHGMRGDDVLDVGCGTGRSVRPLLSMGYRVVGCDLSVEMLAEARRRSPEAELHVADMRRLPALGRFDWITCLNDVVNYLMRTTELEQALASMGRLLRAGGILTFDVNTLHEHRAGFAATFVVEETDLFLCWDGKGCEPVEGHPGFADIAIFHRAGGGWRRRTSRHRQRWWSAADIASAAARAGLEVIAVHGQLPGARIQATASEEEHTKLIYVLRSPERGGAQMIRRP